MNDSLLIAYADIVVSTDVTSDAAENDRSSWGLYQELNTGMLMLRSTRVRPCAVVLRIPLQPKFLICELTCIAWTRTARPSYNGDLRIRVFSGRCCGVRSLGSTDVARDGVDRETPKEHVAVVVKRPGETTPVFRQTIHVATTPR